MTTLYDSAFCSKNPLVYFVLPTGNIFTVFYCLLMFMHFQKNVQNAKKTGSKLSVKLIAQISNGFKKSFMMKTHCLTKLTCSIYFNILSKIKLHSSSLLPLTLLFSGTAFLFYTHSYSSKKKKFQKNLVYLSLYYLLVIESFHLILVSVLRKSKIKQI